MSGNGFLLIRTLAVTKMMPATATAIIGAIRMWASYADAPQSVGQFNHVVPQAPGEQPSSFTRRFNFRFWPKADIGLCAANVRL